MTETTTPAQEHAPRSDGGLSAPAYLVTLPSGLTLVAGIVAGVVLAQRLPTTT